MPAKFNESSWIAVAEPKHVAIILLNAINTIGWHYKSDNQGQNIMTAQMKSQEVISELNWQGDYELVLRWREKTNSAGIKGHLVLITVSEKMRSDASTSCKEKAQQFVKALAVEYAEFASKGVPQPDPIHDPCANFASAAELEKNGYLIRGVADAGFIVTTLNDKVLSVPERETTRHVLVCGPTGSGKSRSVFIPNIAERTGCSMLVVEATAGNEVPDLYGRTAGWRAANGHKILYFNPEDLASDQVNPLDVVNTDADARLVCDLLMRTTTPKQHRSDSYWDNYEKALLVALILHVCGLKEEGRCNLGQIVDLLSLGESGLKNATRSTKILQARQRLEAFFSRGTEHTRSIAMSALGQRLDIFNDARARYLTDKTSFKKEELTERLFTFYLAVSANKLEYKPMMALVWHYLLTLITQSTFKHPLSIILDEFANLGYVQGMKEKLGILRHLNIPIVLGFQDPSQIKSVYGDEAESILSQPATQIHFKPNSLEAAEKLSNMLGYTSHMETEIRGGSPHYVKREHKLATVDQILNPRKEGQIIVHLPNGNPARVDHLPWNAYEKLPEKFPLPPRKAAQVDEFLTRLAVVAVAGSGAGGNESGGNGAAENEGPAKSEAEKAQAEAEAEAYYKKHKAQLAKELGNLATAQKFLKHMQGQLDSLVKAEGELFAQEKEQVELLNLQVLVVQEIISEMQVVPGMNGEYETPWVG